MVTTLLLVNFVAPAVTNEKLAPYSIPFVTQGALVPQRIDLGKGWVDINGTQVNMVLKHSSQLIITFSTEAMADPGNGLDVRIELYAGDFAFPDQINMVPTAIIGTYPYQGVQLGYGSYSYTFFWNSSLGPGAVSMKAEGEVTFVEGLGTGGSVYLTHRTLTVIALPT